VTSGKGLWPQTAPAVAEAFVHPTIKACYGNLEYVSADESGRVVRPWRGG